MGAKHKYYMVVDETAFAASIDPEKRKRMGQFIHEATSRFHVILATSTPDIPEASDRARELGVFDFCDPEDITLCPWPLIRDRRAHVFITNRTSSTDTVQALTSHMGTVAWSSTFADFMKLHGNKIEHKIKKNSVADVFEIKLNPEIEDKAEKISVELVKIYEEPMDIWDKAMGTPPVKSLLTEFNAHARRSRALEKALFLYFFEAALTMGWEKPGTAEALQRIDARIEEGAPKSRCRELLPPALMAIETAILSEPRKLVYFPE